MSTKADRKVWHAVLLCCLAYHCTSQHPAYSEVHIVALEGSMAPEGNGQLFFVGTPVLNDAGQAAFYSNLLLTSGGSADNSGVYRASRTSIVNLVREGEPTPGGNGLLVTPEFFNHRALNNAGSIAFRSNNSGTAGGSTDNTGIYIAAEQGVLQVARENALVPGGNGAFSSFNDPVLNNNGQTAFLANLRNTSGGSTDNAAIYIGDGASLVKVAREGETPPSSGGTIIALGNPALNDAGQAAFVADLSNGTRGIYRGDGGGLTAIVVSPSSDPAEEGDLGGFSDPVLNGNGDVAFHAHIALTPGSECCGIFRSHGGSMIEVAQADEFVPDGNGRFDVLGHLDFNDSGQVAFASAVRNTAGGLSDNQGLFLHGDNALTTIARTNNIVPGGNGRFDSFDDFSLNNRSQVAFLAGIRNTSGGLADNAGLYLYDGGSLVELLRLGQTLFGSTLAAFDFVGSVTRNGDEASGLNDLGEVAFSFGLADGRWGIAISSDAVSPDLNQDSFVNALDYVTWRMGLGTTFEERHYDFWRSAYGSPAGSGASSESSTNTVPEPSTCVLMLGCVLTRLFFQRQSSSRPHSCAN